MCQIWLRSDDRECNAGMTIAKCTKTAVSSNDSNHLHLEDKGAETGSRVTTTGVSQDREETAGNSRTEDTDTGIEDEGEGRTEERTEICAGMMTGVSQDREETAGNSISEDTDTGIEDEGEGRTEERTEICAGTRLMATNAYTKNQDSPIGKEIDMQQWDTLIFKGEHAENENWSLVQNRTGQVGYAPAGFLVVILDTTTEEQESDTTKKGQENSTEKNWIGQEGERRKSYSAAVIDGIKRNTTIYVGDSIIRKTDTRLHEQGGRRSSVFTGSKNRACDRESREDHGKRKWRDHTSRRRDEQHG